MLVAIYAETAAPGSCTSAAQLRRAALRAPVCLLAFTLALFGNAPSGVGIPAIADDVHVGAKKINCEEVEQ